MEEKNISDIKKDNEQVISKMILDSENLKIDNKILYKFLDEAINFKFKNINNIILLIINCIMPSALLFFLEKREIFSGLDFSKLIIIIIAINLILLYGLVLLRNLEELFPIYLGNLIIKFKMLKVLSFNFILERSISKTEKKSSKLNYEIEELNDEIEELNDEIDKLEKDLGKLENSPAKLTSLRKKLNISMRKHKSYEEESNKINELKKKAREIIYNQEKDIKKIEDLRSRVEGYNKKYTMNDCFEWYLKLNISISFILLSMKVLTYINIIHVNVFNYQWTLLASTLYFMSCIKCVIKVILIGLFELAYDIIDVIFNLLNKKLWKKISFK